MPLEILAAGFVREHILRSHSESRQGLQLPVQVLLLAAHARVPIHPAHNARGNATESRHQPHLSLEYRPFEEKSLLGCRDVSAEALDGDCELATVAHAYLRLGRKGGLVGAFDLG